MRDPLDADAWVVLLGEACAQSPADFRPLFERCVEHFPSAACVWYQWLEAELRCRELGQMETLFERCLLKCPHVELWRLYLQYQKSEKRCVGKELQQTYELLLQAVGVDVGAGQLWLEAVDLLKEAVEPSMMSTSGPVQACREMFQQCLVQPCLGGVSLWKEYEQWETLQSGPQAKQILADIADRALVAQRVAKERHALVQPLRLNRMPRVPKGSAAEFAELKAWRAFWTYEAGNPQRLSPPQLQARMQFTFSQALMVLWFTPQTWHEAARWMQEAGYPQAAHQFYTRSLEVLPGNEVLTLAYARLHESSGDLPAARELLEGLVTLKPTPLAFIHLMRLARKADGAGAARAIFARARRAEGCTWQVYAAAADLEKQMGGAGGSGEAAADAAADAAEEGWVVAARILALALERYEGEPSLALHCVNFLLSRNDVHNARAVLERALGFETCKRSRELWGAYLSLEVTYGSPGSVEAVERRRSEAFPELRVHSLYQLAAASSYLGLWPAEERELRALSEEPPMAALLAGGGGAGDEGGADRGGKDGSGPGGGGGGDANGEAAAGPDGGPAALTAAASIVVPNLALCTEYTGEPILLEAPTDLAAGGGGLDGVGGGTGELEAAAMARIVPYQVDAMLEALPKRLVGPVEPPSVQQVQSLFARLAQLPDKLSELPAPAAALPGGEGSGAGQTAGFDAASKRRAPDAFTVRQRKKQQLGM